MLSLRNLGLTCQGYQVKTCRCRIIRTICLPQNCSVIETERLLVWVQLMLAPDNNSMLETFFTWRCHYLFHLCDQRLMVLSDNGIRVSKDWVAGGGSYRDTHKMLEIKACHFQRRNPPSVPSPAPRPPACFLGSTCEEIHEQVCVRAGMGQLAAHCGKG